MKMILNATEVAITSFYETLNEATHTLNATNTFKVDSGVSFPELEALIGMAVSNCTITNANNVSIPTQGSYTKVDGITISYDDRNEMYTANIVLT